MVKIEYTYQKNNGKTYTEVGGNYPDFRFAWVTSLEVVSAEMKKRLLNNCLPQYTYEYYTALMCWNEQIESGLINTNGEDLHKISQYPWMLDKGEYSVSIKPDSKLYESLIGIKYIITK